jgi:hypothetical protein
VLHDYVVKTSEGVNVSLFAAPYTLAHSGGFRTIYKVDANYTITQAPFVEGNTGTSAITFAVAADCVILVAPTVYLTFSDGSAFAGTD